MSTNLDDIEILKAAWKEAYPKRANGGVVGLAGFEYQIQTTLHDYVKAWLEDPTRLAPRGECLSDLVQGGPYKWTITQVKRTGTSASLSKALDELWTIEAVARQKTPQFIPSLQYEVRCARWELQESTGSIERWNPKDPLPTSVDDVSEFRKRIRVTYDPHPIDELVAILATKLHAQDPLGWTYEWVGRLLKNLDVQTELYNALAELKNAAPEKQLPPGIQILSPTDLSAPDNIQKGEVLIGNQPRLSHLRDGSFAPRPWQLIPATEAFLDWLQSNPFGADQSKRVPLFWIAGRSGSGKSILLLQLMERITALGIGPLVWIQNRRRLLPDAMKWSVQACYRGAQPIIVLDDPFSPGEQDNATSHWQQALDHIATIRDNSETIPILLACGPTEQARALEHELSDDIQIKTWILDEIRDEGHVQELSDWFEKRTEKKAPDIGQENVLMVQRFFEWRTGEPLLEFARRFRVRVEALNPRGEMTALIVQTLAVNRLYAGLPSSVWYNLNDRDRDAFEVLKRDHHLSIDAQENRTGLWLSHPHLANALFLGWFATENKFVRAGTLREGILRCFREGKSPAEQTAPLWAIARAWGGEGDESVAGRLDLETIAQTLRESYNFWLNGNEKLPFAHLPIWIRLSLLISNVSLEPQPIKMALDGICPERINETGFRLTCHILLTHFENIEENDRSLIIRKIRECLDNEPGWHEWDHVAIHLAKCTRSKEDWNRLIYWAISNPRNIYCPSILLQGLDIPAVQESSYQTALQLIPAAPGTKSWANLCERLLEKVDSLESVALWAERNHLEIFAPFVLRGLIQVGYFNAYQLTQSWLSKYAQHKTAGFLIEAIIDKNQNQTVLNWLEENFEVAGWGYVYEKFLNTVANEEIRTYLIGIGKKWLNECQESPEWAYVLVKLLDVAECEEQRLNLIEYGIMWLNGNEEKSEWKIVFRKLFNIVENVEAWKTLIERGLAWLGSETVSKTKNIFKKILYDVNELGRQKIFIECSLAWLDEHKENPKWSSVFQKLLNTSKDARLQAPLIERGLDWLYEKKSDSKWYILFQKIIESINEEDQREIFIKLGLMWLDECEENKGRHRVLIKLLHLVHDVERREALFKYGHSWFNEHKEKPGWVYSFIQFLETIKELQQRRNLIDIGLDWLNKHYEKKEWLFFLQRLLEVVEESEQRRCLVYYGLMWLSKNEDKREWHYILQKLLDVVEDAEQRWNLVNYGLDWLEGREEKPEWAYVLQKLIDVADDAGQRQDIIEHGLKWLKGHQNMAGWFYVFRKFVNELQHKKQLINNSLKWLEIYGEHPKWGSVFVELSKVVDDDEQREQIIETGLNWLHGKEEMKVWIDVFKKVVHLAEKDTHRDTLYKRGLAWLQGREEEEKWSYVYQKLLGVTTEEQQRHLIETGTNWLRNREDHNAWPRVYQKLLDVATGEQQKFFLELGKNWLIKRGEHNAWMRVFEKIYQLTIDPIEHKYLMECWLKWWNNRVEQEPTLPVIEELLATFGSEDLRNRLLSQCMLKSSNRTI